MLGCVILCMRSVAEHVDVMWSYAEGVETKETHEQINGGSRVLDKGLGRSKFVKHKQFKIAKLYAKADRAEAEGYSELGRVGNRGKAKTNHS